MAKLIPALTLEAQIKRELRNHLKLIGYEKKNGALLLRKELEKASIREMHGHQRKSLLEKNSLFIKKSWNAYKKFFAEGWEIHPESINLEFEEVVTGTWQAELFKLASFTWSVPVSSGFGRRIRYLVWDRYAKKLMGIVAIGDPVFNLGARDRFVGWNANQRKAKLVCVMDCYVLGAVPPYNNLLCGKLIACCLRSWEIVDNFSAKYIEKAGVISGEHKRAQLVMLTTTSALGKSSLYNRLKIADKSYFSSVGFTLGWGHFHISSALFSKIREYLAYMGDKYASNNRFGQGPNWKLRAVRRALLLMGLEPTLLQHQVRREVFLCSLANNATDVLLGKAEEALYEDLQSVDQISQAAIARWVAPRAERCQNYRLWRRSDTWHLLEQRELIVSCKQLKEDKSSEC